MVRYINWNKPWPDQIAAGPKTCCIFQPAFGCSTLQMLVEICFFQFFACFRKILMQKLWKLGQKLVCSNACHTKTLYSLQKWSKNHFQKQKSLKWKTLYGIQNFYRSHFKYIHHASNHSIVIPHKMESRNIGTLGSWSSPPICYIYETTDPTVHFRNQDKQNLLWLKHSTPFYFCGVCKPPMTSSRYTVEARTIPGN